MTIRIGKNDCRYGVLALMLCAAEAFFLTGCAPIESPVSAGTETVRPERGKVLVAWYGCTSCHEIPAVPIAGLVGPPLRGLPRRSYIAGSLPNTPENMIRWIRYPRQVDASTVMPDMNVTDRDARDIAAFLYTLR